MHPHAHTHTHTHARGYIEVNQPGSTRCGRAGWYFSCVFPSSELGSAGLLLISYLWQMKQQLPGSHKALNFHWMRKTCSLGLGHFRENESMALKRAAAPKYSREFHAHESWCRHKSDTFIEFRSAASVSGLLVFFMPSCCRGLLGHLSRTEPPWTLLEHLSFSCSKMAKLKTTGNAPIRLSISGSPYTSIQQRTHLTEMKTHFQTCFFSPFFLFLSTWSLSE